MYGVALSVTLLYTSIKVYHKFWFSSPQTTNITMYKDNQFITKHKSQINKISNKYIGNKPLSLSLSIKGKWNQWLSYITSYLIWYVLHHKLLLWFGDSGQLPSGYVLLRYDFTFSMNCNLHLPKFTKIYEKYLKKTMVYFTMFELLVKPLCKIYFQNPYMKCLARIILQKITQLKGTMFETIVILNSKNARKKIHISLIKMLLCFAFCQFAHSIIPVWVWLG